MDSQSESRRMKKWELPPRPLASLADAYSSVEMPMHKVLDLDKVAAAVASAAVFKLQFQVPDLKLVTQNLLRTREVGEFVSGALAGAMTKAVLAPLETISVLFSFPAEYFGK